MAWYGFLKSYYWIICYYIGLNDSRLADGEMIDILAVARDSRKQWFDRAAELMGAMGLERHLYSNPDIR